MKFKQGVPDDCGPNDYMAGNKGDVDNRILQAREIYDELLVFYFGQGEGVITSTKDGTHKKGSKHYKVPRTGEDWRFPDLFRNMLFDLQARLKEIGVEVILEKDHFHCEVK
ncbi:MAG: hypothetical protein AABY22_09485 [Nanoarchaeota archaeon]